jgi:hypothetical protein
MATALVTRDSRARRKRLPLEQDGESNYRERDGFRALVSGPDGKVHHYPFWGEHIYEM